MDKRRGNNGWTHLTLYRVIVITLQSALDFVAILGRTEVRKEQQGFPLVYSSEALQHLTDEFGKRIRRGTAGATQED